MEGRPLTKPPLHGSLSRMRRIILLALGFALFISGGLLLWEAHMLGFPDGNISEVDRVLLPYNLLLASGLVAFGFLTLVCAALSPARLPAKFWWSGCACFTIFFWARGPYEEYLAKFLMTSSGG